MCVFYINLVIKFGDLSIDVSVCYDLGEVCGNYVGVVIFMIDMNGDGIILILE